ncbi:MAG: hypothetical protein MPJ25_04480 [Pirellulales bacterium]|nr:hypothetical protein [Pirellulales bacterium]
MTRFILLFFLAITTLATSVICRSAKAISPRNPYRTFNLSGVNYGSMRWERTHRQGRSNWSRTKSARQPQTRKTRTMVVGGIPTGVFTQRSGTSTRGNQTAASLNSSR